MRAPYRFVEVFFNRQFLIKIGTCHIIKFFQNFRGIQIIGVILLTYLFAIRKL